MNAKKGFFIILIIGFIIFLGFFLKNGESKTSTTEQGDQLIIAVCPTFYYAFDETDDKKEIKKIKTQSTAQSLALLEEGGVDLVISGRALRLTEPKFLSERIGLGYDFIFKDEIVVLEKDMQFIDFYTNLSLERIIKDFSFISEQNLTKAEDLYDVLDKGVFITILEDDKMKGEMAHIFQENGERLRLSRLPRLYYSVNTEEIKVELAKALLNF